ncbi:MAG TPA: DUF6476 family protein [Stellaceae bacterium]|nr:DUF6476 family protein [Stellaceae bacterium]
MRALKVLVVVMGVLLVAGVIALAMLVTVRVERGAPLAQASAGPLREALPAGSRIIATELSGDRLLVRVALAEGGEQLLLFDARSGAPVAVITLSPPR